tara:strand:- start:158 stop:484 length:327 start_codon:yes stop_codon:yes gene_type:complete
MAVKKTLKAVPYSKSSKVERWDFSAVYENDSEGDATYYTSTFSRTVEATAPDGSANFAKKAKGSWTKSEIEGLMPIAHWDTVFASQVDSVITNPVTGPVADDSFTIPS